MGGFLTALFSLLRGCTLNHMCGEGFGIDVLVDTIVEKRPVAVS